MERGGHLVGSSTSASGSRKRLDQFIECRAWVLSDQSLDLVQPVPLTALLILALASWRCNQLSCSFDSKNFGRAERVSTGNTISRELEVC